MTPKLKSTFKKILFRIFPRTATRIFSARSRAFSQKLAEKWGCIELNHKIIQHCGNKVLRGSFSGVILSPETFREHLSPFLLGTYEQELCEAWSSIFKMNFNQILDVGAKFGFYAVGLAKRFPGVPVIAFDTDPWAQKATREMSAANNVDIEVRSFCDPKWMHDHLLENSFVFSDCEGYEATLFGSEIPNSVSATILVELHEQFSPGVTNLIRAKYSLTHDISIIPTGSELEDRWPELEFLTDAEWKMAVTEYRTAPQTWMFLRPKLRA
jgi:hypothetical protein